MRSQSDYKQDLLNNLIKGDTNAFEEIYRKYNKKIYAFSLKYLKSKEDAEGVVQDVFLSLWQNCKNLRIDSNLDAWFFTITFNAIRKKFRSLARQKRHLAEYGNLANDYSDEITEVEYNDLLDKTNSLIKKLPSQQKKVFILYREKEYTISEISEELNISKKTVENHLYRARMFIKEALKKEGLVSVLFLMMFLY
jgi:RNA polymerase sigma-70 factor (ECF subfamily)